MLKKIKDFLFAFVYPVRCVGCGQEGEWFCVDCVAGVRLNDTQHCPVCWSPSLGGRTCGRCSFGSPLDGLRVAASYEQNPELARAVKVFKYKFSENLADNLAQIIARALKKGSSKSEWVVVPVPLHKKRQRWRGFNQAELLGEKIAKYLELPFEDLLLRKRNTPQQAKLSRSERLENLKNAFELRAEVDLRNKKIILIDDVATTASTLSECASVLRKAGVREVWGIVLARG